MAAPGCMLAVLPASSRVIEALSRAATILPGLGRKESSAEWWIFREGPAWADELLLIHTNKLLQQGCVAPRRHGNS